MVLHLKHKYTVICNKWEQCRILLCETTVMTDFVDYSPAFSDVCHISLIYRFVQIPVKLLIYAWAMQKISNCSVLTMDWYFWLLAKLTIGRIAIRLGAELHVSIRMNCNFCNPLTFQLVPSSSQNFNSSHTWAYDLLNTWKSSQHHHQPSCALSLVLIIISLLT